MLGSRLNQITRDLEELRTIGATGKKLNRPSDNPAAVRPVLNTRKQLSNVDRYLETMGQAFDTMKSTDGHLNHIENTLVRVKELAINAVNGVMSDEDMRVLAEQVGHMRQELIDAANGTVNGKYIFAGYEEKTKPFAVNPDYTPGGYNPADQATWPVLYQGDANPTELEITPGEMLEVNLTGNTLFLGDADNNGETDAGRIDIFAVVTNVMEAIENQDIPRIESEIDNLDLAADQNRRLRSRLGNHTQRVETAMDHQEEMRIDLQQILSRYEDADAIEAFNNIVQQETAFQAALSVTSKVSKLSILDFI